MVLSMDLEGTILYANGALTTILHLDPRTMTGRCVPCKCLAHTQ